MYVLMFTSRPRIRSRRLYRGRWLRALIPALTVSPTGGIEAGYAIRRQRDHWPSGWLMGKPR